MKGEKKAQSSLQIAFESRVLSWGYDPNKIEMRLSCWMLLALFFCFHYRKARANLLRRLLGTCFRLLPNVVLITQTFQRNNDDTARTTDIRGLREGSIWGKGGKRISTSFLLLSWSNSSWLARIQEETDWGKWSRGTEHSTFLNFVLKFLRFRGSLSFLNTCLWINYNVVEFFYSSIHCWLSDMAQGCTPWVKREPLNLLCSVLHVNIILLKEVVHRPTQESVLTPLESLRLYWSIRWRRAIFKPWSNSALAPWITCRNMA